MTNCLANGFCRTLCDDMSRFRQCRLPDSGSNNHKAFTFLWYTILKCAKDG